MKEVWSSKISSFFFFFPLFSTKKMPYKFRIRITRDSWKTFLIGRVSLLFYKIIYFCIIHTLRFAFYGPSTPSVFPWEFYEKLSFKNFLFRWDIHVYSKSLTNNYKRTWNHKKHHYIDASFQRQTFSLE